jgi:hypothetical protein
MAILVSLSGLSRGYSSREGLRKTARFSAKRPAKEHDLTGLTECDCAILLVEIYNQN